MLKLKRVLAVVLSALMVQSIAATSVVATSAADTDVVTSSAAVESVASSYTSGDYKYEVTNDDTATITDYTGSAFNLTIPSTLDGRTVTDIGEWAFCGCDSLTSVTISDGVESIGDSAFSGCKSLTSVTISDGVTSIGDSAFYNCTSLQSITIPSSVRSIGDSAFYNCTSLQSITIPSSVRSIGEYAFFDCDKLQSIEIPDNVTSIGKGAFIGCDKLQSIEIPNSVRSIGWAVFGDCRGLTSINVSADNKIYKSVDGVLFNKDMTEIVAYPSGRSGGFLIPDSVTSIYVGAFAECHSLTSITIPTSVKSIDTWAFYGSTSLKDVYYGGTEAEWRCLKIGKDNETLSYAKKHYNTDIHYDTNNNGELIANISGDTVVNLSYGTDGDSCMFGVTTSIENIGNAQSTNAYAQIKLPNGMSLDSSSYEKLLCVSLAPGESKDITWNINVDTSVAPGDYTINVVYGADGLKEKTKIHKVKLKGLSMQVYSDYSNLSVEVGRQIKVGVGIFDGNDKKKDVSGVNYVSENPNLVSVKGSTIKDNCSFVTLVAKGVGTAYITFSDSKTGCTLRVPINISETKNYSFSLSNFKDYKSYNVNGMYVDTDSCNMTNRSDGSVDMTFDVYNSTHIYGAVEVYNRDGKMESVYVIDKSVYYNTGLKEVVWDNTCQLIGLATDCFKGEFFTYKNSLNKQTTVNINVPKMGYIKITNDPSTSFIASFMNEVDIALTTKSFVDAVGSFSDADSSYEIEKKIVENLVKKSKNTSGLDMAKNKVYSKMMQDSLNNEYVKKLNEGIVDQIGDSHILTEKNLELITNSVIINLRELDLIDIIKDGALSAGYTLVEDTFVSLTGPAGVALKGIFAMGKAENLIVEWSDYTKSYDVGSMVVTNQKGDERTISGVTIKSTTKFDDDVTFNVFTLKSTDEALDVLAEINPSLYNEINTQLTRLYNISMMKKGNETEPSESVEVVIPVPDDLLFIIESLKIYRVEEDGSFTDMNARIEDNCLIFTTDHFSIYAIAPINSESQTDPTEVITENTSSATTSTTTTVTTSVTGSNNSSANTLSGNANTSNSTGKVATGDSTAVAVLFGVLLTSAVAMVAFRKRVIK